MDFLASNRQHCHSSSRSRKKRQDRLEKSHDIRHDIRKDIETPYPDIVCPDMRILMSRYPYILISCPISGLIM
jgi:hypothetical protein